MIRLKPLYVKILDRVTIQEAPSVFEGKFGFSNSEQLCNKEGFYRLIEVEKTGNIACYEQQDNTVVQSWVTVDMNEYSKRVVSKIRAKYTADAELSILRKKDADVAKFVEYNEYCEQVKREVKIELLTPMNLEERKNELKAKFATKQIEIKQALITAEETVGSDNATLQNLKTQLLNERVRIITIIDNFTTIEEAMAFDIRDEDAKPFMDALFNLINSI